MLRIVWGVIFIVVGLSFILSAVYGSVLVGAIVNLTGARGVTSHDNLLLLREFLFGVGFCFVGSVMVYYGDEARQVRLERIEALLSDSQKTGTGGDW